MFKHIHNFLAINFYKFVYYILVSYEQNVEVRLLKAVEEMKLKKASTIINDHKNYFITSETMNFKELFVSAVYNNDSDMLIMLYDEFLGPCPATAIERINPIVFAAILETGNDHLLELFFSQRLSSDCMRESMLLGNRPDLYYRLQEKTSKFSTYQLSIASLNGLDDVVEYFFDNTILGSGKKDTYDMLKTAKFSEEVVMRLLPFAWFVSKDKNRLAKVLIKRYPNLHSKIIKHPVIKESIMENKQYELLPETLRNIFLMPVKKEEKPKSKGMWVWED